MRCLVQCACIHGVDVSAVLVQKSTRLSRRCYLPSNTQDAACLALPSPLLRLQLWYPKQRDLDLVYSPLVLLISQWNLHGDPLLGYLSPSLPHWCFYLFKLLHGAVGSWHEICWKLFSWSQLLLKAVMERVFLFAWGLMLCHGFVSPASLLALRSLPEFKKKAVWTKAYDWWRQPGKPRKQRLWIAQPCYAYGILSVPQGLSSFLGKGLEHTNCALLSAFILIGQKQVHCLAQLSFVKTRRLKGKFTNSAAQLHGHWKKPLFLSGDQIKNATVTFDCWICFPCQKIQFGVMSNMQTF